VEAIEEMLPQNIDECRTATSFFLATVAHAFELKGKEATACFAEN
jgi:hypothetical protein